MKKFYTLLFAILITSIAFAQGTGCPSVTAVSVTTNTGSVTLPCTATCTDLSASAFNVGETNIYNVNPIPHNPPIAYNQPGGTAISVNTDDVWSNVISLPFPFCFFGQTYTQCIVGSNGAINFNTANAGGYHPWPFSASVPSPDLVQAGNIFGPYHDIDPSVAGSVRWYLLGQAPCRIFVVSYNNLGHYSCTSLRSTHMMVLYETTNVIEVYVQNKATCSGWNGGRAVIGIQNANGTQGYTPPGRNTGQWTVTTPEAWQFVPSGASIYTPIEWFQGATPIGTGNTITVCPSGNTTYTARTTYTRCDGLQIQAQDQVSVSYFPNPSVSISPTNPFACAGQTTTLTANSNMTVDFSWSTGASTPSIDVSPASTTTYTVTATNPATGCTNTASSTVNLSQPVSTACNVLYVTTSGLPSGEGTRSSPMDLSTALRVGACNGTIVKMAIGTYTTDTTITAVTSYITLEGGFDPSAGWTKVSTAGATTIFRTANNITDLTGAAPRIVAFEIFGQTGFRFQDLTIQTANAPDATGTNNAISTYGIHMTNCSEYSLVRTQVQPGTGGRGRNGTTPAGSGGAAATSPGGAGGAGGVQGSGCSDNHTNGSAGVAGGPAGTGGAGGAGGARANRDGCNWYGCDANGRNGFAGGTGNTGPAGTAFAAGDRPTPAGLTNPFYVPSGQSAAGGNGRGGGGGGGGGGAHIGTCCTCDCGSGNAAGGTGGTGGGGGLGGNGGFGGGGSFAVYLVNNGAGSSIIDCNLAAGAAGLGGNGANGQPGANGLAGSAGGFHNRCDQNIFGGNGGTGGAGGVGGRGRDGANGLVSDVAIVSGTAPTYLNNSVSSVLTSGSVNNPPRFNLGGQPTIRMDDIACTFTDILYQTGLSGSWTFGLGSNPASASGIAVTTQYSSLGRKNIGYSTHTYTGFANIILDDQNLPDFSTSAPFIDGQYRVCAGENVSFTALNGGIGYNYIWNIGGTVFSGTTLSTIAQIFPTPGVYTITLQYETSCCGVSSPTSIDLYVEAVPVANAFSDAQICLGDNNGAILSVTGGVVGGTIEWSPSTGLSSTSTTPVTALPLTTTTYTVLLSDSTGLCTSSDNVTVTVIDLLLTPSSTIADCFTPGTASIGVAGGSGSYSYLWSTGETSSGIGGLQPGDYSVTVTDNINGCVDFLVVNVPAGPGALVGIISATNIACAGEDNGTVTMSVSGGTPPYTYSWSPVGGSNTTNDTEQTISNLSQGIYGVTVSDDTGCEYIASIAVDEPQPIVMVIDSVRASFCSGQDNGFIRVQSDGGERPYTYVWTNGTPVVEVNDGVNADNLGVGIYTLVLTDALGCQDSVEVTVSALNVFTGDFDTTICFGESFVYNGTVYDASNTSGFEVLTASNGCDSTVTVNVTILSLPTATIDGAVTICSGDNADITFTGTPNAIVTYTINGGASQTVTLDGLGNATVNTGALTADADFELVSVELPGTPNCLQPMTGNALVTVLDLPIATIDGAVTICSGDNADITFTGTPDAIVTYTINGGASQTVTLDGLGNATVNTGALTADADFELVSVELPGTPNCLQPMTGNALVTVLDLPIATIDGSVTICSGDNADITFTGTPDAIVTYTINGGASQTVTLDGLGNATVNTGALTADADFELVSVELPGTPNCLQPMTGNALVTVLDLPIATIDGAVTICSGDNADITFTGTPNAIVTYTINGGASQTVTLDGLGNATVNTGALTADADFELVSVELPGTPNCLQPMTGNALVTVLDLPTATIDGSVTICSGDNADITFTGTPDAIVTYTINGGASQTVALDGSGNATVNTGALTADADFELVSVELPGTPNCLQSITGNALVTVLDLPTATIDGSVTICSGDNADITFTGTPNAIVTYTINGGASQTVTLDGSGNATVNTGALTADADFELVSVELPGTPNCLQSITGNALVTVLDLPTATIDGAVTICSGDNADITFTGTPNAIVTYTINGGASQTVTLDGSGNATVNTGALTADADFELVSVELPGTPNCLQSITGNALVTVLQLPTASISADQTVCEGEDTDIIFIGTPGAIVTYSIDGGATLTFTFDGSGLESINTGALFNATTYTLISVELPGTPNCIQSINENSLVNVVTLPDATISGTADVCFNSSTNITFSGTPNSIVTYTVNGGANQTVTLSAAGTATVNTGALTANATYELVSVQLQPPSSCNNPLVGSATITIIDLPIATIDGAVTICSGDNADITFTGTPDAIVTYTINGGASQTVTLDGSGNATVNTGALTANANFELVSVELPGTPNCLQPITGNALVTVLDLPTATIDGAVTICSGDNADITFTGTPNAIVTYTINGGASQTVTLDGLGNATVNTGALTADADFELVSVELPGTPNCLQPMTGNALVTVLDLPIATIDGAVTICSGDNADITFTGTPDAIVTYTINGGASQTVTLDGLGNATVNTGALTADADFELVSVELPGTPNCLQPMTGNALVTVLDLPIATIDGSVTICSGDNADITFTGTPDAIVTYTINGGASQTVTLDGLGNATVNTGALTADADFELVSVELPGTPNCLQPMTGNALVTVLDLPIATIDGAVTICSGDNADITFTGTPDAIVTYTINGGASQTVTLDGLGNATVNTGALTADADFELVSVELPGTPNCLQPMTGNALVTVLDLPIATIDGSVTICSGDNADITFTGTPNAIVTYTINGGADQTVTLDGTGNATVNTGAISANTTYQLVSVELPGTPNCIQPASGNVLIAVLDLPTASVSGAATICAGDNANISFTGTPNAIVTYTINGGVNQTVNLDGTGNATVNTGAISANTTYQLVSVELQGTPNCLQPITGSVLITVLDLPAANISGSSNVCSGNNANITFSGTPGAIVTYTINGGSNQTVTLDGSGNATVNTGALTANATYQLISVRLSGTPNCEQPATGNVVVTVIDLPTASVTGTTICSGQSGSVTFTGTPNATVTYTVNGGANQTVTLNAAGTATVNTGVLVANATYQLVSVQSATTPVCSNLTTASAVVNVVPAPTASITGNASVCSGNGSIITISGTPNATVTYVINGGANQTVVLNNAGNATLTSGSLTSNTTYTVISVDNGSCVQTISESITITVNPTFSQTVAATICSNETFFLPNGTPVNIAGSYPVTLTSSQGCDSVIITNLTVNQLGSFFPLRDFSICEEIPFDLNIQAQNMVSYEWQVNQGTGVFVSLDNNPQYQGATTSTLSFNLNTSLHQNVYRVVMTDQCGNVFSDEMRLSVFEPTPVDNPVPDQTSAYMI
jgi:hypothetical protein